MAVLLANDSPLSYGFAGVALFLALFYAEEDWRGKRDWEKYKRAAEATGERFDVPKL